MRRMVLTAAKAMDELGNAEARVWVSAVKAMVPIRRLRDHRRSDPGSRRGGGLAMDAAGADVYEPAHLAACRRPGRGALARGRSCRTGELGSRMQRTTTRRSRTTPTPAPTTVLRSPAPEPEPMTIFDDLRASHEVQRSLARRMTHARVSADGRRLAFLALANELDAHATAEERHFYVPLLTDDAASASAAMPWRPSQGDEAGRRAPWCRSVGDHFTDLAKQLSAEDRDHLDEEEHGTFQLAGKLLTKTQQKQLGAQYCAEYTKQRRPLRARDHARVPGSRLSC